MGNNLPLRHLYMHEVATAINLALALANFFFLLGTFAATNAFFEMDRAISLQLGLLQYMKHPKDYFVPGYFAFFVPAIVIAVCLWLLFRLFTRARLTREFLKFAAGIMALIAAPVFWLCSTYAREHRYGWSPFRTFELYELVLMLIFGILYQSRRWPTFERSFIFILALHFGFWFWQFGPHFFFGGYAGPLAPAVGLFAGLTWVFYLRGLRQLSHFTHNPKGKTVGR